MRIYLKHGEKDHSRLSTQNGIYSKIPMPQGTKCLVRASKQSTRGCDIVTYIHPADALSRSFFSPVGT